MVVLWLFGVACGLLCVLLAWSILHLRWEGTRPWELVVQALCSGLFAALFAAAGLGIMKGSTTAILLERAWTHDGVPGASAVTHAGRVVRAGGSGASSGPALAVAVNSLRGVEAFAHYAELRRPISGRYRIPNLARVDVALAAALLSLAGRRRVELRPRGRIGWSYDGRNLRRSTAIDGFDVRRVEQCAAAAEVELPERLLLDALSPSTSTTVAIEGPTAYRSATTPSRPVGDAPWTPIPQLVFCISRGDATCRRQLRARLESITETATGLRAVEASAAELAAILDALGEPGARGALLRDFERGFALRAPSA